MMLHGVQFAINGVKKHSLTDWGLWLNPVEIPFPEIKTSYTEIEGGHGSIDLTESFGKVFYRNREFPITFTCRDKLKFNKTLSDIASFLHGREAKVTFYFDEEYYFLGRVSVDKYTSEKATGTIELTCTFEPFKYKQEVTVATDVVTTQKTVVYLCDRLEVCPTFKADAEMRFEFKGGSYTLAAGEAMFPDVEFTEGENTLIWHGNGTVTVSYQEGAL